MAIQTSQEPFCVLPEFGLNNSSTLVTDLFFSLLRDTSESANLPPKLWLSEVMMSVVGEPPTAKEREEEIRKEPEAEIPEQLSLLDVLRILAVLEDTTDQLSILNYIMPVPLERKQSTIMVQTLTHLKCLSHRLSSLLLVVLDPLRLTWVMALSSWISDYSSHWEFVLSADGVLAPRLKVQP